MKDFTVPYDFDALVGFNHARVLTDVLEFAQAVKKKPKGDWVDYMWTKFGESDPSPKVSWVKACKAKGVTEQWVVGSGTWK